MSIASKGLAASAALALIPLGVSAAESSRRIEELVVTAEKRESTVSDTSIAITAFSDSMIENMGIQSATEMVNFIPATTRDAYDIRIRGVGRNFRALGGDPGVATYYNGVYSEDFGIASSESALYDVARIEVLRGPQGTLYGRNAIGGAINYITNPPTMDWNGEIRGQFGNLDTQEYYGFLSGPLIEDTLAFRFTGVTMDRDGAQEGLFGTPDVDSRNDQNFALALRFTPTDNIEMNLRTNDRHSDREIGLDVVVDEGLKGDRGQRRTDLFAFGIRPVAASTPGAVAYTDPITGAVVHGATIRPGVDAAASLSPNPAFASQVYLSGTDDLDDIESVTFTNGFNNEEFIHNAVSFDFTWDVAGMTVKYIYGYSDFDYTFDFDTDQTNSEISSQSTTVLEDVYTESHELQLLWQLGDRFTGTSGLYTFYSNRLQDFTLTNATAQGRIANGVDYGLFDAPLIPIAPGVAISVLQAAGLSGPMVGLGDAPLGTSIAGRWEGDGQGHYYHHINKTETRAYAAFTQGVYQFNESWALTLGIRWAEDEKKAFENRAGYFETPLLSLPAFAPFVAAFPFPGFTPLALTNFMLGAATPTFDPANPIAPTCPLTATTCPVPLRLQGVPISFSMKTDGEDDWSNVTWRVNLDWTPSDAVLLYASATTGYRAGGYSLGVTDARIEGDTGLELLTYDKEEVMAYELGFKGTHLDGRLQLFAAVYTYLYDNYQDRVNAFDAVQGTSVDIVQNAPEAENRGFEIEAIWLATDGLTVGGNYSYTETEYSADYFIVQDDNPNVPTALFGEAALAQNLEGDPLKRIPKHKSALWAAYDWYTRVGDFRANASWFYTGEYNSDVFERDLDQVPSRTRTDISLTWTSTSENITVRAFVDNVFDDINIRDINTGTLSSQYRRTANTLYPRFWGVDMRYTFGG